jgi:hypothetical protein
MAVDWKEFADAKSGNIRTTAATKAARNFLVFMLTLSRATLGSRRVDDEGVTLAFGHPPISLAETVIVLCWEFNGAPTRA